MTLWTWLTFSFVEPILDLAVQRSQIRISSDSGKVSTISLPISQHPPTPEAFDATPQGLGATSTLAAAPLGEDIRLPPSLPDSTPSGMGFSTLENDAPFRTTEEQSSSDSKRTLNEEDVWSLPPTFLHRNLFRKYLARRFR